MLESGSIVLAHAQAMNCLSRAIPFCIEIRGEFDPTDASDRHLDDFYIWVNHVATDPLYFRNCSISDFGGLAFSGVKNSHVLTTFRGKTHSLAAELVYQRLRCETNRGTEIMDSNQRMAFAINYVEEALIDWLISTQRLRFIKGKNPWA